MDKEKHQTVKYVVGPKKASQASNDNRFKKLCELKDELFEVESAKNKITLDLPIYLGYFILQYAKLRMLEWYYDFLDKFVERDDFEYIEMDTGKYGTNLLF